MLTRYLTNKIEIGNLMLPRYRGEPNQILLFILKEQGPPKLMQPMKIYKYIVFYSFRTVVIRSSTLLAVQLANILKMIYMFELYCFIFIHPVKLLRLIK